MKRKRSWLLVIVPALFSPALFGVGGLFGISAAGLRGALAADGTPNSCGCYQDSAGSCFCGKKARCGCPGQCEPKGCDEKREKEIRKEIEAETKKAKDAGRRYSQASDKTGARVTESARESGVREAGAREMGERKQKATRMTASQRKELLRLLDLYSAEHGDHARHTVDQVRGVLASGSP